MAVAFGDVVPALLHAFTPRVIADRSGELYIRAAHPDALAGDARKIRLAAGADTEAAVEHVIPHAQLVRRLGVDGRHEIDGADELAIGAGHLVRDVDDELIG